MKARRKFAAALAALLLLGGCGYYVEVNEKSFVIALGIDEGDNGLLKVSVLFTSPDAAAGEDGGGEKKDGKDIVTVEAPTVYSALRLINTYRSKRIDISHTELIIFSQKTAKKGIKGYVGDFVNTRGFRPSIYLCVAQSGAEKFLKSIDPKQDLYIEKYIRRLFGKAANSDVNEAYLYNNYFISRGGECGTVLPLVGVSDEAGEEGAEELFAYAALDDLSVNYTAEELPIDKKDAAVLCGYAVFDNDKMVGTLGITESDLVKMVMKNFPYGEMSLYYPEKDDYVSLTLSQAVEPVFGISTGGQTEISVRVELLGEYSGVGGIFDSEDDCERFSEYLNGCLSKRLNELFARTRDEFGSDIMNIGERAKRNFLTYEQWKSYNWKEKYKTAVINAAVNVKILDFGELKH